MEPDARLWLVALLKRERHGLFLSDEELADLIILGLKEYPDHDDSHPHP